MSSGEEHKDKNSPGTPRPPEDGGVEPHDDVPASEARPEAEEAESPEDAPRYSMPTRAALTAAVERDPRLVTLTTSAKRFLNASMLFGWLLFIVVTVHNFLRLNELKQLSSGRGHVPFIGPGSISAYGIFITTQLLWLFAHWRYIWARGNRRKMEWMLWTLLELLLALMTLYAGLKLFGFRLYWRRDLSSQKVFTLQDETRRLLRSLHGRDEPVRITLLTRAAYKFNRGRLRDFDVSAHERRLQGLLNEFEAEADRLAPGKLYIERVDMDMQPERAKELALELKIERLQPEWAYGVILATGQPTKEGRLSSPEWTIVTARNMYREIAGKRKPIFVGEDALAAGLSKDIRGKRELCYYIRGYGEPEIRELPELQDAITGANMLPVDMPLGEVDSLPASANMVLLLGPKYKMAGKDIDKLIDYYRGGGNLLICLDAGTPAAASLNRLLPVCGLKVLPRKEIVYAEFRDKMFSRRRPQVVIPVTVRDEPLLRGMFKENFLFMGTMPVSKIGLESSPSLKDKNAPLTFAVITTLKDKPRGEGRSILRVWANDRVGESRPMPEDSEEDIPGPIPVAAISYRIKKKKLATDTETLSTREQVSRVFLAGDSDWITHPDNSQISSNIRLLNNVVRWVAGEVGTLGLKARTRNRYQVPPDKLTDNHFPLLMAVYAVGPAGLVALIGIVVLYKRRKRAQSAAFEDTGRLLEKERGRSRP